MRRLSYAVILSIFVFFVLNTAQPSLGRSAQSEANVFAFSVGLAQADNSVLYSVFVLTDKQAVQNLTISMNIPDNALSAEVANVPQHAGLLPIEADKRARSWHVDALEAGTILGPFTQIIHLPETVTEIPAGISGTVTWTAPEAGSIEITPMDGNLRTFEETGAITFDALGTTNDKGESVGLPVGDSGLWLYVPPETVAGNVTLRFTRLLISTENTPASDETWWCALIKIETDAPLTLNKPIIIAVPTRQALTPGMKVQVLAQTGNGEWQDLPTTQGMTIANDGVMALAMVTGDLPSLLALGVSSRDRQQASGSTSPTVVGSSFNGGVNQFGGASNFNGGFGGGNFSGSFNSGAKICNFNFCN